MNNIKVSVKSDGTQKMRKMVSDLGRFKVFVGIPEGNGRRRDFENNAILGYLHENGSPANNLPARPFLKPAIEGCSEKIATLFKDGVKRGMAGRTICERVGLYAQAQVKDYIVKGENFAPLSPKTIAQKGSTKPLIDTAQLLNSVSYVIRES